MVSTTTDSDLLLAQRAFAADAAAWDEIIRRYGERIYNLAFRFAGQPAEAEDLTQEIFLKLYRSLDRYRGEVPLLAWALRLSRNLCIDHYRRGRARHYADQVSDAVLAYMPSGDDPLARTQARQSLRMVHEALKELPQDLGTVLLLRDFQQLRYDEIASFLDVPVGTVKSRLNRARQALVERLGQRFDSGGAAVATVFLEAAPSC